MERVPNWVSLLPESTMVDGGRTATGRCRRNQRPGFVRLDLAGVVILVVLRSDW